MSRRLPMTVVPLVLLGTLAIPAGAQERGPITPPPKYEVKRLPTNPDPGKPPAPAEEIIKRLAANEDLFKRAYDAYRLEQTIRVQEIGDDSSPGGEYAVTGEIFTKPDGKRYERILKQPESTLHRTTFSLEDVETLAQLPLFILTTEELPKYDITYQGQQKLDEIGTLNFRVKPKQIVRGQRLFDGVIWVDDLEFAIVKSYGKFVTEVVDEGNPLPFSIFETYRENFAGKYWFPTYIRSDDTVALSKGQLHLRLLIRSTNLQPGGGATAGTTSDTPKPQLAKPPQN
jgi:hypothetical protein